MVYGDEVPFAVGSRLAYPDFSVEFLGTLTNPPLTSWRFEIRVPTEAFEVACTTGGVREGVRFEVAGRPFELDLCQVGSDESRTLVVALIA